MLFILKLHLAFRIQHITEGVLAPNNLNFIIALIEFISFFSFIFELSLGSVSQEGALQGGNNTDNRSYNHRLW